MLSRYITPFHPLTARTDDLYQIVYISIFKLPRDSQLRSISASTLLYRTMDKYEVAIERSQSPHPPSGPVSPDMSVLLQKKCYRDLTGNNMVHCRFCLRQLWSPSTHRLCVPHAEWRPRRPRILLPRGTLSSRPKMSPTAPLTLSKR